MRYVVIAMLLAIVASLGSAAFFMLRGRGDSRRMARALAWRVGPIGAVRAPAGRLPLGFFQPGSYNQ